MFEALEARTLLSATIVNGVLTIQGSENNDTLNVTYAIQDDRILYRQKLGDRPMRTKYFDRSAVTSIQISALGGNDSIVVHLEQPIGLKIYGGRGNDGVSILNSGRSYVSGGHDNDTIQGGAGRDNLEGGGGNDVIQGMDGADILNGGSGTDFLSGGNGNDQLRALDGGRDTLTGDAGTDTAVIDFLTGSTTPMDSVFNVETIQ